MMDDLEDLFAQSRADIAAAPPAALMARVMQDAGREQMARDQVRLAPALAKPLARPLHKQGFWAGLVTMFGGGGVIAGLGSVAIAGLYIGFAQPGDVLQWSETLLADASGLDSLDLMPGVDALLFEE